MLIILEEASIFLLSTTFSTTKHRKNSEPNQNLNCNFEFFYQETNDAIFRDNQWENKEGRSKEIGYPKVSVKFLRTFYWEKK